MSDMLEVSSELTRVELYRGQALVTRRARVPAGTLALRLGALPLLLDDDSLRVRLQRGAPTERLVDLHLELDLGLRQAPLRTELQDKLRELQRRRVELWAEQQRHLDQLQLLESLAPSSPREVDLPEDLAFRERQLVPAWLSLADNVREQSLAARKELRRLQREQDDLKDQQAELRNQREREAAAAAAGLAQTRKAVLLRLEGTGAGAADLELELSYLVPAARWAPEYELRVQPDQDQAELVLKAHVAQRTGEDWERVELSFSTADLTRSAELPRLDSWRIGRAQPPRPTGWRELPETVDELFEDYDRGLDALPPAPQLTEPELARGPRLEPTDEPWDAGGELSDRVTAKVLDDLQGQHGIPDRPAPGPVAGAAAAAAPPAPAAPPPAPQALENGRVSRSKAKHRSHRGDALESAYFAGQPTMRMERALQEPVAAAEPEPEPEPAPVAAGRKALAFAELRMQGPDQRAARGQLLAAEPDQRLPPELRRLLPDAVAELLPRLLDAPPPGAEQLDLPRDAVPLSESAGNFAARLSMEGRGDVPANGQPQLLTLLRRGGPVRRLYRCVPLLDPNVYQVVLFENPLGLPLLAGPVRIYNGGDFVASGPLATTPPGQPVTINLGIEPDLRVARNTFFEESTEGLFGGDTALKHRVEIEARSRLSRPARLEVHERVPISRDDEVEVKLLELPEGAEDYDQKDRGQLIKGGKRLIIDLAPGETRTVALAYRITLSSKLMLRGGNRRD
jgi:hypothetical protein